jgi:formyl-CoA transferase
VKLSDTPATVRTAPPILGQHTAAVLGELGYGPDDIERFKKAGVV